VLPCDRERPWPWAGLWAHALDDSSGRFQERSQTADGSSSVFEVGLDRSSMHARGETGKGNTGEGWGEIVLWTGLTLVWEAFHWTFC
jgi:hypothetical protein